MIICNVTWTKPHRATLTRWYWHDQTSRSSNRKWGFEGHFFSHFSVSFLHFPRFVNNNLGHSIKPLVGFWGGSIGAAINNAKHRRKDSSSVCCFCCRKPALHLHKWRQVQTWYSSPTRADLCLHFFFQLSVRGSFPACLPSSSSSRNTQTKSFRHVPDSVSLIQFPVSMCIQVSDSDLQFAVTGVPCVRRPQVDERVLPGEQ